MGGKSECKGEEGGKALTGNAEMKRGSSGEEDGDPSLAGSEDVDVELKRRSGEEDGGRWTASEEVAELRGELEDCQKELTKARYQATLMAQKLESFQKEAQKLEIPRG